MKSLTQAQLAKIVKMPEWMFDKQGNMLPRYQGRVFASNEGWMFQPYKVHPEFPNKQMPAYCISAIPELAKFMEQDASDNPGVTQESLGTVATDASLISSASYTRRSASRYMLNVSLDEALLAEGGDVEFTLSGVSGLDSLYPTANVYTIREGQTSGTLRFDLRFDPAPTTPFTITLNGNISIGGSGSLKNADRPTVQVNSLDYSATPSITIG